MWERPSVRLSVRYAISFQTAGSKPIKFVEWLAYTIDVQKHLHICRAHRSFREVSIGSVGICNGVSLTVQFWPDQANLLSYRDYPEY